MFETYRPEPYSDFTAPGPRRAYGDALAQVEKELGRHHPLVIGGVEVDTDRRIESVNPAKPAHLGGRGNRRGEHDPTDPAAGAPSHPDGLTEPQADP